MLSHLNSENENLSLTRTGAQTPNSYNTNHLAMPVECIIHYTNLPDGFRAMARATNLV